VGGGESSRSPCWGGGGGGVCGHCIDRGLPTSLLYHQGTTAYRCTLPTKPHCSQIREKRPQDLIQPLDKRLISHCHADEYRHGRNNHGPHFIRTSRGEKNGKFFLRYDKISSQNMQCKGERIRQKSKVKNLPNYPVQEIRETAYAHSSSRRPAVFLFQVS
jgi:hypothetical protein